MTCRPTLKVPRPLRRSGARDIVVRVVKYNLIDDSGEASETFTLITTLFDPTEAPGEELTELYRDRCTIETALLVHSSPS